mmetsp:Transcript_8346/g.26707  ORF Transcript_8346/g.26707 Transcript_8346/m.26707 type:complete len:270 (-) Transcript_8346:2600-3409(-)
MLGKPKEATTPVLGMFLTSWSSKVIKEDGSEAFSSSAAFCARVVSASVSPRSASSSFSSFASSLSSVEDFSSMLASLFLSSSFEEEVVGDGVVSPKYAARFFSASASVRAAEFSTEDRTSSAVETSELFSLDSPFFPALAKIESTSSVIGSKIASSSTVAPSTVSSASLETSSGISAPPPPPKSFFTFSAAASSSLIASLSSSSSSFSLFLSLLVFFFLLDDEEDLDFFPPESEEKSSASALRNNLSNLSNLPSPSFFIYSLTESTVSS